MMLRKIRWMKTSPEADEDVKLEVAGRIVGGLGCDGAEMARYRSHEDQRRKDERR